MLDATLNAIFLLVFALSLLSAERLLYHRYRQARETENDIARHPRPRRPRQFTRRAARQRRAFQIWHLIRYRQRARRFVWLLRALVVVCPLLGLLGTVTGMMGVFDALASGRGDSTAALTTLALATEHITFAMLPTLVGMLAAVPGMVCLWLIQRRIAAGERYLRANLAAQ